MKRPFAIIGFAFYGALFILNFTSSTLLAFVFSTLAFFGALTLLSFKSLRKLRCVKSVFLLSVSILSAGLLYAGALFLFYLPDSSLGGRTLSLTARIDGNITEKDGYLILPLKVKSAFDALTGEPVKLKSRLSVTAPDTGFFHPYDIIKCTVKLSSFESPETLRYYRSKGIYIGAKLDGTPEILQTGRPPLKSVFHGMQNAVRKAIDSRIGGDEGALIKGVIMGEKDGIPASVTDQFRRSGLSHTMAVSGLHITIFSGALMLILNAFGLSRKWIYGLCALAPFLIAGVAGFAMSALRASVMGGVYFLGKVIDRDADGLNSLGFALLIMTLFSPFGAGDAGLALSAAATLGLILSSDRLGSFIRRVLPGKARNIGAVNAVAVTFCCSLSAVIFTLPVSALYFGAFSLSGIAANIFAGPFVHAAFLSGVLTASLYFIFPLSAACAAVAGFSARVIIEVAAMFSATPFSYLYTDKPYVALSLLFAALAGAFSLAVYRKKRLVRPVIALSLSIMVFCAGMAGNILASRDKLTMVAVNVGSGDCAAVIKNRCAVVVDCGGAAGAPERLKNVLRAHNVRLVNAVIVSHTHRDHAEGIDEIINSFPVRAVFLPPSPEPDRYRLDIERAAKSRGAEFILVEDDMTLTLLDGLIIRMYVDYFKKGGFFTGDDNENCLVAGLSYRRFDCLFTGDIGFGQERLLADYGGLLDMEVLKVAHHGSKYSTGDAFLKQVTPLTAIVSVWRNSYGHPTAEALLRLAENGADVLRTDQNGNITIRTDGRHHYSISTERGAAS